MAVELSYCVVNTEQRQLLRYCLDAIARERAAVPFETEVLVLDNASRDGSAGAARAHGATTEVIALEQRRGKGENDTTLLAHNGTEKPSAWRFPGPAAALLTALWMHRRFVVQSRGTRIREVDWVQ